jgi:hypothetical protein
MIFNDPILVIEPTPPPLSAPFSLRAAAGLWDRIQTARRVSGASLTEFAACTGYMPTLEAGRVVTSKIGGRTGFIAERWTLQPAPERLDRNNPMFGFLIGQSVNVMAYDSEYVPTSANKLPGVAPCAICGQWFEPGEYIYGFPFKCFAAPTDPQAAPCGPNCQGAPQPGEYVMTLVFHARHRFEDESHYVPLPTPREKMIARATKMLKSDRWFVFFATLIGIWKVIKERYRKARGQEQSAD